MPGRTHHFSEASSSEVEHRAYSAEVGGFEIPLAYRFHCGCSSVLDPQPSKLRIRVRFPVPGPINAQVMELLYMPASKAGFCEFESLPRYHIQACCGVQEQQYADNQGVGGGIGIRASLRGW